MSINRPATQQYADLDTTLRVLMDGLELPGMAAGLFSTQGLEHVWTGGVLDLEGGRPVTDRTLFHMASVTKPFVATAVMQLAENGLLAIDAPVREYLPYFALDDERAATITVAQLLSHTSGMPDVADYEWKRPEHDDGALERHVRSLANRALLFSPGERFAYSNLGYEVLGDVIAKVSGQSFESYVAGHIFEPLEMTGSTLRAPEVDWTLKARGHSLDEDGGFASNEVYPYNRRHAPSSTLCSNVIDMAKWGTAWLRGGSSDTVLLSGSTVRAMLTPRAVVMPPLVRIGLGWFLSVQSGKPLVEHSGGDTGFRSDLLLAPEAGVGVILMANCDAWYLHTQSLALALVGGR